MTSALEAKEMNVEAHEPDTSLKNQTTSAYQGYWSFVREDFKKRHRFWPSWMINKAMNTRLYLSDDFFIQYSNPKKTYKEPRPIRKIVQQGEQSWTFVREEGGKQVSFELKKEGELWIYRENEKVYQLVKNSPEDVLAWKENS
jgi:sensor histidine kinase YesM